MDLVIVFGPPAVGKMTVAYALTDLTGLPTFHNHMTIDLVLPFFPYGSPPFGRLVAEFRRRIFEEVAAGEGPGLVFTFVWDLDDPRDRAYIDGVATTFAGARVSYVELYATQEARLARNRTEFRLAQKPSKRDVAWSDANLRSLDEGHRLNGDGEFFHPERFLRLDTTEMPPDEAARQIQARFGLPLRSDAPLSPPGERGRG